LCKFRARRRWDGDGRSTTSTFTAWAMRTAIPVERGSAADGAPRPQPGHSSLGSDRCVGSDGGVCTPESRTLHRFLGSRQRDACSDISRCSEPHSCTSVSSTAVFRGLIGGSSWLRLLVRRKDDAPRPCFEEEGCLDGCVEHNGSAAEVGRPAIQDTFLLHQS